MLDSNRRRRSRLAVGPIELAEPFHGFTEANRGVTGTSVPLLSFFHDLFGHANNSLLLNCSISESKSPALQKSGLR
jgi:hypothetical protein